MSVGRGDDAILLSGDAPVEDAEPLAALLAAEPALAVDWSQSGRLHTAVVQVLLAFRPAMVGTPGDAFARRWIAPLLPTREG